MKLLVKSVFCHMKNRLLQTILTCVVATLVMGMVAVLFHLASSFQHNLRTLGLKEMGRWHYQYYTDAEMDTAEMFEEMAEQFGSDDWFSDVELAEENSQVFLRLTVKHPNFFMTRTMKKKFREVENEYGQKADETRIIGSDHNYNLLASYGDLSRENGMFSYLVIFFLLLGTVSIAAILTLGAVFHVSAMQREREFALLSGMGAGREQLIGMVLVESIFYCIFSIPAGYFMGIFVYWRIQKYLDSVIYSLFHFPPSNLVVSIPYSVALFGIAAAIILLSGLKSAKKVAHISPVEVLGHTKEIRIRTKEKTVGDVYEHKVAAAVENWLARKSCKRFRHRNRAVFVMLSITFALCLVLNGVKRYATEVLEMSYDMMTYNYEVELYSEDKAKLENTAGKLVQLSNGQMVAVKESKFALRSPYPLSTEGKNAVKSSYQLPDASLVCIDEKSFQSICRTLDISENREGIWGIFLDTERRWHEDGVQVKGNPYEVAAGDIVSLYNEVKDFEDGDTGEKTELEIIGVYSHSPLYTETDESICMQILVPENVFSQMETKRAFFDSEEGTYHIFLRGNLENDSSFEEIVRRQMENETGIICHTSNYMEQVKQQKDGITSFEFLCVSLIAIFVFICICGNFTVSWAVNKAREREYATLLSIGMTPHDLQKMHLFELLYTLLSAFCTGTLAGGCCYQIIYWIYTKEYRISWHFPWEGLLLGIMTLIISVGITDFALQVGSKNRTLAERLRIEE